MIYVFLSKKSKYTTFQPNIISFIKQEIKPKYNYKIIHCNDFIIESKLPFITKSDILLFEPIIAYYNLDFVKRYLSIIILLRETVFTQKISKLNPINEVTAINHGFYLYYLTNETDITNDEWNIVIKKDLYLLSNIKLHQLIIKNNETSSK